MAGEAAEYYMSGSNDWQVGAQVFKKVSALRYMDDPTKDGSSIGHADDFTSAIDVHHSSGVFNKAFYLLANTAGWNTQTAFQVMALANQTYWTAQSTLDAAAAFAGVGVQTCDVIIDPPDNVLFNGVPRIISGDLRSEIVFTHEAPQQVISTRFDIRGGIGDADIYVKFGSAPTTSDYDCHHIDRKYDKHECFGTKNAYKK